MSTTTHDKQPEICRSAGRRIRRGTGVLLSGLLLLFVHVEATAGGGAWNREPDGYYIKLGPAFLSADSELDPTGTCRGLFSDTINFRNGNFGSTDINFYVEYGFTSWLTGVASTQYKVSVREAYYIPFGRDSTVSASGLGETWLGARVRLIPDMEPFAAALTLSWKVPTGSPNQSIPLGTGVADYEAALALGTPFRLPAVADGYTQLSAGYRLRNVLSNEFTYQAEVGVQVASTLMMQGIVDGIHTTADLQSAEGPETANVYTGEQSFARWTVGAIYEAGEGLEINAGYGNIITGRNTLYGGTFSIGVAWKK